MKKIFWGEKFFRKIKPRILSWKIIAQNKAKYFDLKMFWAKTSQIFLIGIFLGKTRLIRIFFNPKFFQSEFFLSKIYLRLIFCNNFFATELSIFLSEISLRLIICNHFSNPEKLLGRTVIRYRHFWPLYLNFFKIDQSTL